MSSHEYTQTGVEAALWAWGLLWQPEQSSYARVRLLDALLLSRSEGLQGWLFTSLTDGSVKSKSRQNWTLDQVVSRCSAGTRQNDSDGSLTTLFKAHVGIVGKGQGSGKWKDVSAGMLQDLLRGGADGAIVSFAHLAGSASFVEVQYDASAPAAKFTTHTLYSGSTLIEENHRKGMNYPLHSKVVGVPIPRPGDKAEAVEEGGLPSHRQVCLSKEISSCTKAFVTDLVKQLEARGRLRITKMAVVLVLEANPLDDERAAWLHHVKETSFLFRGGGGGGGGVGMGADLGDEDSRQELTTQKQNRLERRSNAVSDLTHRSDALSAAGRGAPRVCKCQGDFCLYDEDAKDRRDTGGADDSGDLKTEVAKARRRHHPDEKASAALAKAQEDKLEEEKRADAGGFFAGEEAATSGVGGVSGAGGAATRTVPFKAIALARDDMHTFASEGRQNYDKMTMGAWPEGVFYWWLREGGKGSGKVGGGALPASSAHFIGQSIAGLRPSSGDDRVAMAERKFQAANGLDAASLAAVAKQHQQRRPSLGTSSFAGLSGSKDDSSAGLHALSRNGPSLLSSSDNATATSSTAEANDILYDLQENHYTGYKTRSAGQISWFYSGAKVCERCFSIYRDMERRRVGTQQALLKKQRAAATAGQNEVLAGKEIERRIFEQRKFASRMSKNLRPTAGGEDVRFNAMLRSTGPRDSSSSMATRSSTLGAYAPKVLPPLPWQLRDHQKRQEYEDNGNYGPAFVRNIRTKAQQMAALVQQDRMMERVRKNKLAAGQAGKLGGQLDEDSLLDGGESQSLAPDFDWRRVTGTDEREKVERETALARAAAQRKVTGGLGENRPKPKSKDFDPERLMHGWQRDMEKWRESLRDEHKENYTGLAAPTDAGKALREKTKKIKSERERRLAAGGIRGAGAGAGAAGEFEEDDDYDDEGGYGGRNYAGLQQGSTVSQLTMDPSMYQAMQGPPSVDSLSALDDDQWIRRVIGRPDVLGLSGSGNNKPGAAGGGGGGSKSVSFQGAELAGKPTPAPAPVPYQHQAKANKSDFTLRVSGGQAVVSRVQLEDDEDEGDDDDDDDEGEGIGWSPFVIPVDR